MIIPTIPLASGMYYGPGATTFKDLARSVFPFEITEEVRPSALDTSEALSQLVPAYGVITSAEMTFVDAVTLTTAVRVGLGTSADPDLALLSGTTLSANTQTRPPLFQFGTNAAYSNQAASTAVSNTVSATTFDTKYSMPANSLKPGDRVRVSFQVIATATNSTDTLAIDVVFGGTTITGAAARDVADNDIVTGVVDIIVRSVGATGTFVAGGYVTASGASGTATSRAVFKASTAVDTTAAFDVGVQATWSVASSSNSCRCDVISIDVIRPVLPLITSETQLLVTPVSASGVLAGSFTAATKIACCVRGYALAPFSTV